MKLPARRIGRTSRRRRARLDLTHWSGRCADSLSEQLCARSPNASRRRGQGQRDAQRRDHPARRDPRAAGRSIPGKRRPAPGIPIARRVRRFRARRGERAREDRAIPRRGRAAVKFASFSIPTQIRPAAAVLPSGPPPADEHEETKCQNPTRSTTPDSRTSRDFKKYTARAACRPTIASDFLTRRRPSPTPRWQRRRHSSGRRRAARPCRRNRKDRHSDDTNDHRRGQQSLTGARDDARGRGKTAMSEKHALTSFAGPGRQPGWSGRHNRGISPYAIFFETLTQRKSPCRW